MAVLTLRAVKQSRCLRRYFLRRGFTFVVTCAGLLAVADTSVQGMLPAQQAENAEKRPSGAGASADVAENWKSAKSAPAEGDRDVAMKFASDNDPELFRLLEQLEKSRSKEFSRAVRELTQQIQLLERVRERNPARYTAQLQSWQRDSQIRVLMAKWSVCKDPELERRVRDLLQKRRENRLVQLTADRNRVAEQLKKLDEQLGEFSAPMEEQLEKEWGQLSKKTAFKKVSESKSSDASSQTAAGRK